MLDSRLLETAPRGAKKSRTAGVDRERVASQLGPWQPARRVLWGVAFALLAAGCNGSTPTPPASGSSGGTGATTAGGTASAPKDPKSAAAEPAGEELQPYDPPPLAELDKTAEWVDMPVRDSLALWKEELSKTPPTVTPAEALALKNDSPENNAKILAGLGRQPASESEVDYEATFNRHMMRDVKSTNPIMGSSVEEFDVSGLTAFGLFSFDWKLEPFAATDTVVTWQSSKDRLLDKVVLRDDLFWSDGKPITAHDVVFSFQTIMNPKVPVPAMRSGTDKLRWVHAYDDRTLVFFHKEALATNVWNLNFGVIPKHAYEKSLPLDYTLQDHPDHVKYENDPISGGPYKLTKRIRGQELVLTRRDDYYMVNGKQVRDKPYFKEVRFRVIADTNTALLALKKGDLDELLLTPEVWKTQTTGDDFYERCTKSYGVEWTTFHFQWNLKNPLFADVRTRKALSLAFDYDEMLNKSFYGLYQQSAGIFHPDAWCAPKPAPALYKQDLSAAEKLLEEAGWEDSDGDSVLDRDEGGKRLKFEFNILCPQIPERIQLCTLLKECLDKVGIVVNVRPLEPTVMQQKLLDKDFQAAFGGWGTGTDPDTSVNIWGTGEGRNFGSYSNPEVDKLFEAGRKEFDRAKRAEIYGQIHTLTFADQPYTWLYSRNSFYAFNKQLRGYAFSPRGPYHYGPGVGALYKVKP
jgi:peptide/nickel transport system substrate-binding protein